LNIEDELKRLQKTYLTGIPFTEAHQQSFSDLLNQMQQEGIAISSAESGLPSDSSLAINHNARIRVEAIATEYAKESPDYTLNLRFSLVDTNGNPIAGGLAYDVSFDWRMLDGSAKRNSHFALSEGYLEGTVVIPRGSGYVDQVAAVRYSESSMDSDMRWAGEKLFLIQVSNPVNIIFEGNTR